MFALNLSKIIDNTDPNYHRYLQSENFVIFDKIDSTNSYLLERSSSPNNKLIFCLAEQQTAGRGRLDRIWLSPPGNIYLSILWNFKLKIQELAGLSIAIAIAVNRALNHYGATDLKLKWPNDILYENSKLAGILIENIAKSKNTLVILGIGVNILPNQPSIKDLISIQNLQNILKSKIDRNVLIGLIISETLKTLNIFAKNGLGIQFINEWHKHSYKLNSLITIKTANKILTGINRGIDHQGNLLLEIKDNIIKLQTISSGEISI